MVYLLVALAFTAGMGSLPTAGYFLERRWAPAPLTGGGRESAVPSPAAASWQNDEPDTGFTAAIKEYDTGPPGGLAVPTRKAQPTDRLPLDEPPLPPLPPGWRFATEAELAAAEAAHGHDAPNLATHTWSPHAPAGLEPAPGYADPYEVRPPVLPAPGEPWERAQ